MRMVAGIGSLLLCVAVAGGCDGTVSPEGARLLQESDLAYRRADDASTVELTSRFLELHPRLRQSAEAYYLRGLARKRQGRTDQAKDDFQAAVSLSGRVDLLARAHLSLGEIAFEAGDMAKAQEHYAEIVEINPSAAPPSDQALYRLGSILQRQGKWRQADARFMRLIRLFDGSELARRAEDRARATRWSIQVGAFADIEGARQFQRKCRAAGLDARMDLDLRGGKLLRLVRVGSYPRYELARANLERIRKVGKDAYITPAR